MVFKQRRFHTDRPETDTIDTRGPATAAESDSVIERAAADYLASLGDVDATQVSVTLSAGSLRLSGYVGSVGEADAATQAMQRKFAPMPVQSTLQVG